MSTWRDGTLVGPGGVTEVAMTVEVGVETHDVVSTGRQKWREHAPDVAQVTGDEHSHSGSDDEFPAVEAFGVAARRIGLEAAEPEQ